MREHADCTTDCATNHATNHATNAYRARSAYNAACWIRGSPGTGADATFHVCTT